MARRVAAEDNGCHSQQVFCSNDTSNGRRLVTAASPDPVVAQRGDVLVTQMCASNYKRCHDLEKLVLFVRDLLCHFLRREKLEEMSIVSRAVQYSSMMNNEFVVLG